MPFVASEVARLRKVVVQRPGPAHAAMRPAHLDEGSADYLLFDDLVDVPHAQAEHDQLVRVLRCASEVRYVDDLLLEALANEPVRLWVAEAVGRLEALAPSTTESLKGLGPAELALALTTGRVLGRDVMNPLPNLLFARDLAAVVGSVVVVGNASKRARRRESILTWAIVQNHAWFEGARVSALSEQLRASGGSFPMTIEGGDVLVISETLAVIGASERTTWSMIATLGHELIGEGFTRILVAEMPKQRSSMHLDTVFTIVDRDCAVVYGPILERGGPEECTVVRLRKSGSELVVDPIEENLVDALELEGHPMDIVRCGGGDPLFERREQWTDGANFVALAPGVIVGYARNLRTAAALTDAGFRVLDTDGFLAELEADFAGDFEALVASKRRYAVGITGSELVRGRGGPRCLTFPVERG